MQDAARLPERLKVDSGPPPILLTPEDRALLDGLRARESARVLLRARPGDFIRGEVRGTQDGGFFDPHTRAKTIKFQNTSTFDVSDLKGHIRFRTVADRELGSVPFVASGFVYAGESAVLEVKSGELTGQGTSADVLIDSVHIWN